MASPDEPIDPGDPTVHGRPDFLFPIEYPAERVPVAPARAPAERSAFPSSSNDWLWLAGAVGVLLVLRKRR
jgi:hypothetical protein